MEESETGLFLRSQSRKLARKISRPWFVRSPFVRGHVEPYAPVVLPFCTRCRPRPPPDAITRGYPARYKATYPTAPSTTLEGQTERVPAEDVVPEPEVEPIPKTLVEEAPDPQPEVDASATDALAPEVLTVKDEEPKRPKSPWTPSYSVTTLSGSAPVEEPEPHPVTHEPPVDVEAVKEEHPKENGTTSDVFEFMRLLPNLQFMMSLRLTSSPTNRLPLSLIL